MYMDEKKDSKLSGSVFHGLLMGVLALTVYFLFNAAARSTVLFIAVAAVILTIAGGLIFWFAGKANKKALKRYGIRAISLMGNAAGLWDYIKGV